MLDMCTPKSQVLSASHFQSDSKTPTPRRKPHCKSCGSPMLGHKRGLCPTPCKLDTAKVETLDLEPIDLTATFKNLKLEDQDGPEERSSKRRSSTIPRKAETLASLATGVKNDLNALAKPGVMSDSVPDEDEGIAKVNIQKWLQELQRANTAKAATRRTPRLSDNFSPPYSTELLNERAPTVRSARKSLADTAQPLGRTTTDDEREAFFQTLAEKSKKPVANVFKIDMQDIHELAINAKRLEFHARVIAPKYADGSTGHGWLVLGKDKQSVDDVFGEVEKDVKSNSGLASRAFASGSALGAIATWVCLAYS